MADAEDQRHLLHVFSTFAVGGPQTRFTSIANALGDRYCHSVLAMDDNHAAKAGLDPMVDCEFETMPVVKSGGISMANLSNARGVLRRVRPNLLCTYNWGAIEWSLANWLSPVCPQVHVEDGFGPDESPDRQQWRRAAMRRLFLSRCARVIVPSRVLYDVAVDKWHLPQSRMLYIPNGIDCDRFAAMPDAGLLSKLRISQSDLVVGTVAALRPEKNLVRLLRAFSLLAPEPPAKLVIVGDGPERARLESEAARLSIADRVVFTGTLSAPERVLGRFDVFALSSDTEQMPNSVLEAMASKLPVVATDVGDLKRMLAPDNARFVFACNDEAGMVRGLAVLLSDRSLRRQVGGENRRKVCAEYSLATMVSRYEEVFGALTSR
jgi:glycosyltransferase involved in cell wall biosynthesis